MQKKTVYVSGKRKQAIARAAVYPGKGIVRVNKEPLQFFEPEIMRMKIMEPLLIAGDYAGKIDIDINVIGGGISGQAEAARLAIARGIVGSAEDKGTRNALKQKFLEYDRSLLVADVRRNEPHKPNDSKPRAARQKSYR
ncbi:30S ribosomal protein S9 [archaeon]|nr:30S ribosomal protein S9 [archaeon]